MDSSYQLRRQISERLEEFRASQAQLAQRVGVTPQTLNDLLTGKKKLLNRTFEAALEALQLRAALLPVEQDPEAIGGKALIYGYKLFPQAPAPRHSAFASSVAWLVTEQPTGLMVTLRALTVQAELSPLMGFDQAVVAVMPLVYGPLTQSHRAVLEQNPEGDDRFDLAQMEQWRREDQGLAPTR